MEEPVVSDFNVYVGTETGILKGINLNQKAVIHKNFHKIQALDREQEITSVAWGNEEENEVLMGLRNQTVKVFDTEAKAFVSSRKINVGEGPIVSLGRMDGITITAMKSGQVTLWQSGNNVEINALGKGEFLTRMRQDPTSPSMIATGGKESDLHLWDFSKPEEAIFTAKNVKPDMLELRVPVWITDISYLGDHHSIAISSRHKHIRLYDPKRQRRPTISFEWEDSPLTCISAVPSSNGQVVVGTAHGRLGLFDLRGRKPEEPVHVYKGFAGAVRDVVVHPKQPLVFSVSLDRFLRVHNLASRKLVFKEYLKSRLNCLLVRENLEEMDFIKGANTAKRKMPNQEAKPEAKIKVSKPNNKVTDAEWDSLTI
ncbi:WD repeat-containing protein 74-like [Portunus trituberculatus]|uniref:WD repeat-containing protein 74-like n=1 Tax=Portunus trituberculatus TaxID=210409 RepID=UPI001E1CE794|nr:WD repeat-containing protein 74-like [Portunus trituberculatus]XP_045102756.1 WD repeat-containing protein 74-like [Portunus trituberculatus]